MSPSRKFLVSIMFFVPLLIFFTSSLNNSGYLNSTIENSQPGNHFQTATKLSAMDFPLDMLYVAEVDGCQDEEEEQRSSRIRIGAASMKRIRRTGDFSDSDFFRYILSDCSSFSHNQLHLRI